MAEEKNNLWEDNILHILKVKKKKNKRNGL